MKYCFSLISIYFVLIAGAQQTEQYSQYVFNQFGINPAFAGMKECLDLRFGYRNQWLGYEGAPKTAFANGNGRILKRRTNHRYKHGVGLSIKSDAAGAFSRTQIDLAYAYHVPVGRKFTFSMGIFAGFMQHRFNTNTIFTSNVNDPVFSSSQAEIIWPLIQPGVLLYSSDFYIGLSANQIISRPIKVFEDSKIRRHYHLNIGKLYKLDQWKFLPSVMLKYVGQSRLALDLNALANYKDNVTFGLSYRNGDAVIGMFQFNFLKKFTLGYAFDFTTSKLRHGGSNTHEIMLGISACPLGGVDTYICPSF